jgi:hypothetical protein
MRSRACERVDHLTARRLTRSGTCHNYSVFKNSWSHRLWPKESPDPKPARATVLPDAAIRAQVEDRLRMESALQALCGVRLDAKALQTEMNRMALNTKAPERLNEMFAALGNDPVRVAECLVRPELAQRRLRKGYANDPRCHSELRGKAEAWLAAPGDAASLSRSGGTEQIVELVLRDVADAKHAALLPDAVAETALSAEEFQRECERLLANDNEGWLADATRRTIKDGKPLLRETADSFVAEEVLEATDTRIEVRSRVWVMHLPGSNVLTAACNGLIGGERVTEAHPAARPDVDCLVPGGDEVM